MIKMDIERRMEYILEEVDELEHLRGLLNKIMSIYYDIEWPKKIQEPHHVSMELEKTYANIESRIDDISKKLGEI